MEIISGIYKITNTITGDFYIGSSKNIKRRWSEHKVPSAWKRYPNNPMYQDMLKYGVDKFEFQILEEVEEVEEEKLKEMEQQFIETLKPTYNSCNAKGWDIERHKEWYKEYQKSDKYKEYQKTERYKESHRKANNKYYNQLCNYNGETLTLNALSTRFRSQGIPHPIAEAKKYLIQ